MRAGETVQLPVQPGRGRRLPLRRRPRSSSKLTNGGCETTWKWALRRAPRGAAHIPRKAECRLGPQPRHLRVVLPREELRPLPPSPNHWQALVAKAGGETTVPYSKTITAPKRVRPLL